MKINPQSVIADIHQLREKYVGTSWQKFQVLIVLACKPEYKNRQGKPYAEWMNVANAYLSELRKSQEFLKG